ncbi:rhodanese-like domain-containing protein [Leptolyngbya cf. ectocarpi LEGE 11479]|uniref:Rhodanese-like domain-containing protein n=1 Tax=Leptolyngbya cf. ectocarpi LEGE 11479 TaxID=1828722 RepID=A0A928ZWH7_LEPEC|nr:rhodanese-like domain-containing protein [Leptolyngbya ectocarpi]MBE9068740.1 rhodanese-like domain-containing protein [Leptolyngbya cf. ectocarpi LEGE 11479]
MISTSPSKPTIIDVVPEDFVQSTEALQLIDVRSRFEYNLFHAPDTINLSLPRILMAQMPLLRNLALPQWFWELPKDEPIAVICLTAHRSPMAAQILVKLGFSQVFNITGGMMAWQKAGLPTHRDRWKE